MRELSCECVETLSLSKTKLHGMMWIALAARLSRIKVEIDTCEDGFGARKKDLEELAHVSASETPALHMSPKHCTTMPCVREALSLSKTNNHDGYGSPVLRTSSKAIRK